MHIPIPFVDLDTLGLRRSRRHKKESTKLQESQHTDSKNKALAFLHPKIMMTLALTAFTSSTTRMIDSSVHCYQTRIIEYKDFLETIFDGSSNQLSPFAQIYLTSRSNKKGLDIKREQIMMIWSFKRKRHLDSTLNKYRAMLCCHGEQQQWGVNFWDTYAQ